MENCAGGWRNLIKMNEKTFFGLRAKLVTADRIFRKLNDKKLLNQKQKKEIKKKLGLLSYIVMLNNPKIINKELREANLISFVNYFKNRNSSSKFN